jgi:hypothetical protein
METTAMLEIDALAERITRTASSLDAATHRLLTDVREFDQRVRVAHALAELPRMDDELRLGQLSFSKVRALTRVATPDNEARLVEIARGSTAAQLERVCRVLEQLQPRDPQAQEERRWLRSRDQANGMVRIEAQLRPEEAARVLAACDVFAGSAAERADALLTMAEATLRGDQPQRPPVEIVVHIDAATLAGNHGDTGIPAEISRRLLCDAAIIPALDDQQGRTRELGHKSRVFAGALRRALLIRARGCCEFPGCTHRRYLEGHHVRHWIHGGETTMGNGLVVCTAHHAMLHSGGARVVATADGFQFLRPDGRPLRDEAPPRPGQLADTKAPPPTWDGEPVDYDAVIAHALC